MPEIARIGKRTLPRSLPVAVERAGGGYRAISAEYGLRGTVEPTEELAVHALGELLAFETKRLRATADGDLNEEERTMRARYAELMGGEA